MNKRVDRLTTGLDGHERALLALKAMKQGRQPDPLLLRITNPQHAREYNRCVDLIIAANQRLGFLIAILKENVESLSLRSVWLASLGLWALNLEQIAELLDQYELRSEGRLEPVEPDSGTQAALERALWSPMESVLRLEPGSANLAQVIETLHVSVVHGVRQAWQQLRATEVVLVEIARELGEDPLKPVIRRDLEDAMRQVRELAEEAEVVLGEPSEKDLAETRRTAGLLGSLR